MELQMSAVASLVEPADELKSGRIPSLDGLRAVAIVLMMTAHIWQTKHFPSRLANAAWGVHGEVGVEIFFVISGFLITMLILREIEKRGRVDVKGFYVRRGLRILPAYFAYLGVVALLQYFRLTWIRPKDWIAAVTYTTNFVVEPRWEIGHLWSLSVEEHFYLMWPLVMLAGRSAARITAMVLMAGCFAARWVILIKFPAHTSMAEVWTFTRLDTIAAGCLLALLAWEPGWRRRLDRWLLPRARA